MARFHSIVFALVLTVSFDVSASAKDGNEFFYGFGGFAIKPGSAPIDYFSANFDITPYTFFGNTILWDNSDFNLTLSTFSVYRPGQVVRSTDKADALATWKAALLKEISASKSMAVEMPFVFNRYKGLELRISNPTDAVIRVFFLKEQLFTLTLRVKEQKNFSAYMPILDSFRLLTKTERVYALIAEFAPPPIVQERPPYFTLSDSAEMGIQGRVRRIRESTRSKDGKNFDLVRESYFDPKGFVTGEVNFLDGYPDVITSWGWVNGQRVNIQSAVNFPNNDKAHGREIMVSGSLSLPFVATPSRPAKGMIRDYGNRFETKLDDKNRIVERRRITSFGSTVLVERYSYLGDTRSIKSTDDSGGFLSSTREKIDERNNVLELHVLLSDGSAFGGTEFQYKFDGFGNWIEKTVIRIIKSGRRTLKKVDGIIYRDIQYYETNDRKQIA